MRGKALLMFVALPAMVGISVPARAQLGGLGAPKVGGAGSGATPEQLNSFIDNAAAAEKLASDSSWVIAKAVLAKEEFQKLVDKRNAIVNIKDPKEKEAKTKELEKDKNAQLQKVNYEEKSKEMEKEQDQKRKEATADGVYNWLLSMLKNAELADSGRKLVSGPPSPAIAGQLPRAKDAVASIGGQLDSQKKVFKGMNVLAKSTGLKALPTKASDTPHKVELP